jgi:DNA-binding GntR family transcriptional regulator
MMGMSFMQDPLSDARSGRPTEIFATLKRRILQWEYPPSYRFTEDEISKEFGVSRSPVREALRMLEESSLVERAPYRGCTVKQPNLQEIKELYDVRIILETAAVALLAARGLSPALHSELTQTWSTLAQTQSYAEIDSAELASYDRRFHEALAQATGNQTLVDLLSGINDRLHVIRMLDINTIDRLWATCHQHMQILGSIATGDPTMAQQAMRANIETAQAHVEQSLKDVIARAYFQQRERV